MSKPNHPDQELGYTVEEDRQYYANSDMGSAAALIVCGFENLDSKFLKTELVNKEKYLLKALPILPEQRDELVNQIKDLAEHEINALYGNR